MEVLPLDSGGVWRPTPGYQMLAVDDGAVRFECPCDWIVATTPRYVWMADRCPPDDRALLALSWRRIPMEATILPVARLVADLAAESLVHEVRRGPVIRVFRPPLELAWIETRYSNRESGHDRCTRLCLARAGCTQALTIFDFNPEDRMSIFAVWNTFLKTLAVGETIADPILGHRREKWG